MISFFGNDDDGGLGRRKRYRPDPLGRLGQGDWVDDDEPNPFGRVRDTVFDDRPDTTGLSTISNSVGMDGKNNRTDVAVAETLLHQNGVLDTNQTKGPTGYFGMRADQAIRTFQKDRGLKVDGLMLPNGPTIKALQAGTQKAPTLITPGLATAALAKPKAPAGTTVAAPKPQRKLPRLPNSALFGPDGLKRPNLLTEPYERRTKEIRFGDDPGEAQPMVYRPDEVWENGHWRPKTPEEQRRPTMRPLAAKTTEAGTKDQDKAPGNPPTDEKPSIRTVAAAGTAAAPALSGMAPSATELAGMLARGAVRSAGPVGAFAAAMAPKDTGGGELTEPLGDGVRWRHHRDESSGGIEVRDPETGAWTPRPDLGRAERGPDGRIMVHPPRDRGFPAWTQPPVQTPGFPADPPERPRPPEGASKLDVPNHTGSPAPRPEGADVETFPDQSGEFGEWNVQASGDPKRTVKGGIMPETPTKPVQWFDPDRHPEIGQAHAEWMKSDAYRELEHRREGGQPTRPAESPVWKSMKNYRVDQGRQVKTNGLQGKKLRQFQWDNKHLGEIEVLDHGGNHLGVIHPLTGAWIKGKNPSHKNDRSMLDTDGRPVPV